MGKVDSNMVVKWLAEPEDHNYPAAASYLSLLRPAPSVEELVRLLQAAPVTKFLAKDIFRASGCRCSA